MKFSFSYNIYVERNKIQKEKREKLNYSLKELHNLTSISTYRLKDFELGLSYPKDKEKDKIIALSISQNEYQDEDDLGYPYIEKENKNESKIKKTFKSKYILVLFSLLIALFTVLFSFSIKECIPFAYDVTRFYDSNLIHLRE